MNYSEMSRAELEKEKELCTAEYHALKAKHLQLDMSRGKPSDSQIRKVLGILDVLNSETAYKTDSGINVLNYGCPDGLPECKQLFADILGVPAEKVFVGGNSSLSLMFDYINLCMVKGASEFSKPWILQDSVKFLCPSPGYDRHFAITEYLGIEMIPVDMTDTGPDMDQVEKLARDKSVKGMFCVPKYSNPTGATYSDETVKRLAAMETADDFRIIWDNAYCIHDLFGREDSLLDMLEECERAGNPDRAVEFCSTSKISLSGSGIAAIAANHDNLERIKEYYAKMTIGYDKANQYRHVLYFKNLDGIKRHMAALSDIISPKFEVVLNAFEQDLGGLCIADWTKPNGGYFISLDVMPGCAKRVFELCKEAGVKLTNVGATYPYGNDPKDSNIRIAPTFPSKEELTAACEVLTVSVRLAALENLLG